MKKVIASYISGVFVLALYSSQGFANQTVSIATLPTQILKIGGKTLTVEVADTEATRMKGLMYRQSMPEDHGMLFIFDREDDLSFWMKNTFIPLSIAYFNKKKVLVDMMDMAKEESELVQDHKYYTTKVRAQYALEVNQGWFAKNKIKVGDKFELVPKAKPKAASKAKAPDAKEKKQESAK